MTHGKYVGQQPQQQSRDKYIHEIAFRLSAKIQKHAVVERSKSSAASTNYKLQLCVYAGTLKTFIRRIGYRNEMSTAENVPDQSHEFFQLYRW
jgi:hypothetical protein